LPSRPGAALLAPTQLPKDFDVKTRAIFGLSFAALASAAVAQADQDPYLWLEEIDGARALAQVKQWNAATEAILTATPEYEPARQRALAILNDEQQIAAPEAVLGDQVTNLWRDAKNARGLCAFRPWLPTSPASRNGAP
jgi:prolyl oligopeptidase